MSSPYPGEPNDQDRVKVVYCWYRHDHEYTPEDVRQLSDSERYMACPGCDHTDRSLPGEDLPEYGGNCPECAALGRQTPMERVSREILTPETLRFAEGKRLVVIAPNQNRVFYDDAWPYTVNGRPIRDVPVGFFKSYDLPLEPWASCDTIWDMSYQVISNALERRAYEFLTRVGGVIITSGSADGKPALMNATGSAPFEFTDRPISLAQWRGMGAPQVEYFQPHGMVGELQPYMQYMNGQFRSDMGLFDYSTIGSPERSKDIPVGTVRALERTGEVPVDDHAEQVRDTLSSLFGVWYDMERAIMTERQMVRLRGPDGADMYQQMRGEELPNVDVIVGASPNWDEFDAERANQFRLLMSAPPGIPPDVWSRVMVVLAEVSNIPIEMVRKLQVALAPPPAPPGAPLPNGASPPAAGMGPMPMPPPIAARMNGVGGNVPTPVNNGQRSY